MQENRSGRKTAAARATCVFELYRLKNPNFSRKACRNMSDRAVCCVFKDYVVHYARFFPLSVKFLVFLTSPAYFLQSMPAASIYIPGFSQHPCVFQSAIRIFPKAKHIPHRFFSGELWSCDPLGGSLQCPKISPRSAEEKCPDAKWFPVASAARCTSAAPASLSTLAH